MNLIVCYSADSSHCSVLLQILWLLYDKDTIQEEAILKWDDEKKDADDLDKVFVKQSEEFIKVSIIIHGFPFLFSKGKRNQLFVLAAWPSSILWIVQLFRNKT